MSYSISIHGHKQAGSDDEARDFEQQVAEKAKQLVAELEGVTSATLIGGQVGTVNLAENA